jgi:hypothetical protein
MPRWNCEPRRSARGLDYRFLFLPRAVRAEGARMKPSFDPGSFVALTEQKGELQTVPLPELLRGPGKTLRIAQSKSALKRWRRAFEFHKQQAVNGRKEVISNGNCNS